MVEQRESCIICTNDPDVCILGTLHTNPLNLKAGVGFPYFGLNKNDIIKGSIEDPYYVSWFATELQKQLEYVDSGGHFMNVSVANIKDEMCKQKKIDLGMERVFFAGNTSFLVFCRIYLAPYMDIFMSKRDRLFGQIGMNACGLEFHTRLMKMYESISGHQDIEQILCDAGWIDSDFEKYDKVLLVLKYAVYVLWLLILKTPFFQNNNKERNRIKELLKGLSQYVIIIGNDVFLMIDGIPSGVFATAWVNCFAEALIEILQFYYLLFKHKYHCLPLYQDFVLACRDTSFFKVVALINYGDDNLKFIHTEFRCIYSHDGIKSFSKFLCMGITPARKSESTIDFKTITNVMFFKKSSNLQQRERCLFRQVRIFIYWSYAGIH